MISSLCVRRGGGAAAARRRRGGDAGVKKAARDYSSGLINCYEVKQWKSQITQGKCLRLRSVFQPLILLPPLR